MTDSRMMRMITTTDHIPRKGTLVIVMTRSSVMQKITPRFLFRALERASGWHLCLTAKLGAPMPAKV